MNWNWIENELKMDWKWIENRLKINRRYIWKLSKNWPKTDRNRRNFEGFSIHLTPLPLSNFTKPNLTQPNLTRPNSSKPNLIKPNLTYPTLTPSLNHYPPWIFTLTQHPRVTLTQDPDTWCGTVGLDPYNLPSSMRHRIVHNVLLWTASVSSAASVVVSSAGSSTGFVRIL